jgi:hypothetical protein
MICGHPDVSEHPQCHMHPAHRLRVCLNLLHRRAALLQRSMLPKCELVVAQSRNWCNTVAWGASVLDDQRGCALALGEGRHHWAERPSL